MRLPVASIMFKLWPITRNHGAEEPGRGEDDASRASLRRWLELADKLLEGRRGERQEPRKADSGKKAA